MAAEIRGLSANFCKNVKRSSVALLSNPRISVKLQISSNYEKNLNRQRFRRNVNYFILLICLKLFRQFCAPNNSAKYSEVKKKAKHYRLLEICLTPEELCGCRKMIKNEHLVLTFALIQPRTSWLKLKFG